MQKVASVKGQRKTERKGPTNEIENGQWQKKKKKLYLILEKALLLAKEKLFSHNLGLFSVMAAKKPD